MKFLANRYINYNSHFKTSDEGCLDINKLILDYIEHNESIWKNAKLHDDLPMQIEAALLKANAGFYNNLFKKHMIDYNI